MTRILLMLVTGTVTLIAPQPTRAQPGQQDVVHVEAFGAAILGSVNYERLLLSEHVSARVGIGWFPDLLDNGDEIHGPMMLNVLIGRGEHRLEAGAGLVLVYAFAAPHEVGFQPHAGRLIPPYAAATVGYRWEPRPGGRGAGGIYRIAFTPRAAGLLRAAVDLYRGDLLEGVDDDWCIFERERLRLRYLEALERLIRFHQARGAWTDAAAYGQRLLARDPYREHVHREVIRCHLALGDRAAALRQFETCARLLRQDLEAEPGPETLVLAAEARGVAPSPAAGSVPAAAMDEVLTRLRSASQWLEEMREQVTIVIRDVERARALAA